MYKKEGTYQKEVKCVRNFFEAAVFTETANEEYCKNLQVQCRELERKKIQFRDERNAWQRQNYIEARVEQKLDLLESKLTEMGKVNFDEFANVNNSTDNDLLVILSDLHIGQCFTNNFGSYDSDIAKLRMDEYLHNILDIQKIHNSENCYISLQGDLISNSIHKTLAITNREDVIDQIKIACELISSFCYKLSSHFNNVYLSDVSGNHSRIDRKEDALHDERLDRLISWGVGLSLAHINNFHLLQSNIDSGIAILKIRGKAYVSVHGDMDPFSKQGVSNLVLMLGFLPYAILYGHLHTCAIDEANGIKMIRGGSLAGSGDQFTLEKRLTGKPSQMVCVCTSNGVKAYYVNEFK